MSDAFTALSQGQFRESLQKLPVTKKQAIIGSAALAGGWLGLKWMNKSNRKKPRANKKNKPQRKKKRGPSGWKEVRKMINITGDRKGQAYLAGICLCSVAFVSIELRKARIQGELFKQLFLGNSKKFNKLLIQSVGTGLSMAIFNKILANTVSSLGRNWHKRIVLALHKHYFSGLAYYRLKGDTVHDRITGDVPQLTRKLALCASDMISAVFQFTFFSIQILRIGGRLEGMGPLLVMSPVAYMLFALTIAKKISPNFAFLQRKKRVFESKYRQVQSRLQQNAEAISFFGGEEFEKNRLMTAYNNLKGHLERQIRLTWFHDVVMAFLQKYCQTTLMMGLILIPFFSKGARANTSTKESAHILFEMRYLGDLILHEFYALGMIARLLTTLQALGGYVKRVGGLVVEIKQMKAERLKRRNSLLGGQVLEGNTIKFENVTIETPTKNILCKGLTFEVKENEHLLVCGPNGAGKSSIFRCLGTLWPIPEGTIRWPGGSKEGLVEDVFYLPQKPYNVLGPLKAQITYPDPPELETKLTPQKLRALLKMVELEYLMDMNAQETTNWEDKLSLGETQRLAMARLFWHNPKYAILDECTSAVSLKMEQRLFVTCRRMGITLITISHRPALQEYHDRMLILHGDKNWSVVPIEKSEAAKKGEFDLAAKGKTREESLQLIMKELEGSGDLSSHSKAGASLKAIDRIKLGKGLWAKLFHLNSLMFNSKLEEFMSLGALAALVIMRTWMSNSIAHLNGRALHLMLKQDISGFGHLIKMSLIQGMGQAILGPSLEHLEQKMSLMWRSRLTNHILNRYMKYQAYFKLKETMPDLEEIGQIDQVLAEDVAKLTEGVANQWHDFVKPLVDIIWFARGMWGLTGAEGVKIQFSFIFFSIFFLRMIRPNLGKLTAAREKLHGDFRFVHGRLRQHSESVAFFNGSQTEQKIIESHFKDVLVHQKMSKRLEHTFGVVQQFILYWLPKDVVWFLSMVIYQQSIGTDVSEITIEQQGILSHDIRYLGSVVNHSLRGFASIIELYGKTQGLIGHVDRVSKLLSALDKVEKMEKGDVLLEEEGKVKLIEAGDVIKYEHADILTPNHTQILAKDLSFTITRNKDRGLLVTGPNGVGKTSIFRIMCNLWPLNKGLVVAPKPKVDVMFVSTTPYMPAGTLAEQISYPDQLIGPLTSETVAKLKDIMQKVKLTYLHERIGFESYQEGFDQILSLGEQQRLNVARVLWHKPRFACLDECTSAVALDGEEEIYEHIANMGCTVLTASQKPWLINYHSAVLNLTADGKGGYEFKQIDKSMKFTGLTRLNEKVYTDKRQKVL